MADQKKDPTPKKITGKEKVGAGSVKQTAADLAADYQWSVALLNSDPELRKVFRKAIKNGWTPSRFTAEIQDTTWFKKHSSNWRQNELARIVDPATWNAERKANRAAFSDLAASMGVSLDPKALGKISDDAMAFGWNEAQQRNALAAYIGEQKRGPMAGMYTGEAGKNIQAIRELAKRNGYKIPKGKLDEWATAIARGDATVDDLGMKFRKNAAAMYPGLADRLNAGEDLEDLASPYKDTMSRLLEVPSDEIDLNDNTLRKALSHTDTHGKAAPMPIYNFEDAVRKDSRWQYTDNARNEIMGQVLNLGRSFGKTG
jgi:hypothetical protein